MTESRACIAPACTRDQFYAMALLLLLLLLTLQL